MKNALCIEDKLKEERNAETAVPWLRSKPRTWDTKFAKSASILFIVFRHVSKVGRKDTE